VLLQNAIDISLRNRTTFLIPHDPALCHLHWLHVGRGYTSDTLHLSGLMRERSQPLGHLLTGHVQRFFLDLVGNRLRLALLLRHLHLHLTSRVLLLLVDLLAYFCINACGLPRKASTR